MTVFSASVILGFMCTIAVLTMSSRICSCCVSNHTLSSIPLSCLKCTVDEICVDTEVQYNESQTRMHCTERHT